MKKFGKWFSMALAALFLLLGSTQAQTEKGRMLINANLTQLSGGLGPGSASLGAGLQFGVGGFALDNLALGTRMSISGGISRIRLPNGHRTFWGLSSEQSIFARYYIPIGKNVRPFVEMEGGTGFGYSQVNGQNYESGWFFGQVNVGTSFFFAKNTSLDLSLGYRATKSMDTPSPVTFGSHLQAKVGMSFYLPGWKRKKFE